MHKRFRAFCTDCGWEAPDSWRSRTGALLDLNDHIQNEHGGASGVKLVNKNNNEEDTND
jgi:hypothetical protein